MIHNEEKLLQRIRSGDDKAFARLMEQYADQVYALVVRIIQQREDAEELTQDVFIKAYEQMESFSGRSSFATWLYRIALNECLTFMNRKHANNQLSIDEADTEVLNQLEGDTYFDGDEGQKTLLRAVQQLPEKQQIIFNLKYFKDMKYEEISEILGTSIGALKASYHHAVKKIEQFLEKHL